MGTTRATVTTIVEEGCELWRYICGSAVKCPRCRTAMLDPDLACTRRRAIAQNDACPDAVSRFEFVAMTQDHVGFISPLPRVAVRDHDKSVGRLGLQRDHVGARLLKPVEEPVLRDGTHPIHVPGVDAMDLARHARTVVRWLHASIDELLRLAE